MIEVNFADIFLTEHRYYYFSILNNQSSGKIYGIPKAKEDRFEEKLYAERNLNLILKGLDDSRFKLDDCPYWASKMPYEHAENIINVFNCRKRLLDIINNPKTELERNAVKFVDIISKVSGVKKKYFGVTGSLCIGKERPNSDIDITIYGINNIKLINDIITELKGENKLQTPHEGLSWHVKGPFKDFFYINSSNNNFTYSELLRKSRRFNFKILWNNRKIDLYFLDKDNFDQFPEIDKKLLYEDIVINGSVIDDKKSILLPSIFTLSDIVIKGSHEIDIIPKTIDILSLINTARLVRKGDRIEIKGNLLQSTNNDKGLVLVDTNLHYVRLIDSLTTL